MKVEYIVMGRDQPNNAQPYSLENTLGKILSFSIVEGQGDPLLVSPRGGDTLEAARCRPKCAACVGRRKGLWLRCSVSRLICSATDFRMRMLPISEDCVVPLSCCEVAAEAASCSIPTAPTTPARAMH